MRALITGIVKGLVTTVIFFGVCEGCLRIVYAARSAMVRRVPLPYSVGDDYGPVPPWLDRMMILVPDDRLIWRNLPRVRRTYVDIFSPAPTAEARTALLRRFLPTLPREFEDSPTWSIALNSDGFRGDEFAKPRGRALRIACVGDSWTFGMNVNQDRSYPSRLLAHLRGSPIANDVEVLNFGVLGYSSFQGRELLRSRVLAYHPDVVAIGFGMNDSEVAGYRDRDMVSVSPPRLRTRVREAATDLEFYKLLNYFALTLRFRPKPLDAFLREQSKDRGSGSVDYSTIEPWTRVSPPDYQSNMREMIGMARASGAAVVLLDNELWPESPYRAVLQTIAASTHAPLVDSLQIVEQARARTERDIERRLGLASASRAVPTSPGAIASAAGSPAALTAATRSADAAAQHAATDPGDSRVTVVFRVSRGRYAVPKAIAIAGTDPQLGDASPNVVWMHDDGAGGDERAGDGVWSLAASFAPGTHLSYVYTNSGTAGRWEGLDVPHIRSVTVPQSSDGRAVYLPIETFGEVYMQADDWHTNATGYDQIASSVAEAIAVAGGRRESARSVAPK
jgi:lysophospholipase L1-like esterase